MATEYTVKLPGWLVARIMSVANFSGWQGEIFRDLQFAIQSTAPQSPSGMSGGEDNRAGNAGSANPSYPESSGAASAREAKVDDEVLDWAREVNEGASTTGEMIMAAELLRLEAILNRAI